MRAEESELSKECASTEQDSCSLSSNTKRLAQHGGGLPTRLAEVEPRLRSCVRNHQWPRPPALSDESRPSCRSWWHTWSSRAWDMLRKCLHQLDIQGLLWLELLLQDWHHNSHSFTPTRHAMRRLGAMDLQGATWPTVKLRAAFAVLDPICSWRRAFFFFTTSASSQAISLCYRCGCMGRCVAVGMWAVCRGEKRQHFKMKPFIAPGSNYLPYCWSVRLSDCNYHSKTSRSKTEASTLHISGVLPMHGRKQYFAMPSIFQKPEAV